MCFTKSLGKSKQKISLKDKPQIFWWFECHECIKWMSILLVRKWKNSSPTKAIAIAQFYQLASRYWLQCLPCTHSFSRPDTIYFRELEESSLINGLACIRTLSRLLASASHTRVHVYVTMRSNCFEGISAPPLSPIKYSF